MIRITLENFSNNGNVSPIRINDFLSLQSDLDNAIKCDLLIHGASSPISIDSLGIIECYTAIVGLFSESMFWGDVAPFMTYEGSAFFVRCKGEYIYYYLEDINPSSLIGQCHVSNTLDDIRNVMQEIRSNTRSYFENIEQFIWSHPGNILYPLARRSPVI